jgi:hypothetical protein
MLNGLAGADESIACLDVRLCSMDHADVVVLGERERIDDMRISPSRNRRARSRVLESGRGKRGIGQEEGRCDWGFVCSSVSFQPGFLQQIRCCERFFWGRNRVCFDREAEDSDGDAVTRGGERKVRSDQMKNGFHERTPPSPPMSPCLHPLATSRHGEISLSRTVESYSTE